MTRLARSITVASFLVPCLGLPHAGCSKAGSKSPKTTPSPADSRESARPRPASTGTALSTVEAFARGLSAAKKSPPDYEAAASFFVQAVKAGGSIDAYRNLALCHIHLNRLDRARRSLREGLQKHRNHPDLELVLAEVESRAERFDKAAKLALRVTRKRKKDLMAKNLLAYVLLRLKKHDDALIQIQRVLAKDPSNAVALSNFGLSYIYKGDARTASLIFTKALRLKPSDPDLLTNRAIAHIYLKQPGRAVEYLEKAVQIDQNHVASRLNLGKVYLDNLDYRGALKLYEAVLLHWPAHKEAMLGRSRALFGLKRFKEALAGYGRVLARYPGEARALYQTAVIYQNHLEDPGKALLYYTRYAKSVPGLAKDHKVFVLIKSLEAEVKASRPVSRKAPKKKDGKEAKPAVPRTKAPLKGEPRKETGKKGK